MTVRHIDVSRPRSFLVVAMFAIIGSVAGLFFLIFAFAFSKPDFPVSTVVTSYTQPEPHPPATLTVKFFGRVGYTRTAPISAAFDTEVMFWQWVPLFAPIMGGTVAGGLVGYMVGRWFPRTLYWHY